jgi:4-amino-4-deoxy-L-arabinose transferase-like glycosyltransferase
MHGLKNIISRLSPTRILIVWIAIYAIFMAFTLNNTYPLQGDESFYTVSAANMVQTHSYMVPEYFGQLRFQKPVLTYWIVAASYKIFGISLWSGRIPPLILSCLTLLVVYYLGRLYINDAKFGLFSVFLLSASFLFVSFSRIAMNEPVLAFLLTCALYSFARADSGNTLGNKWLFTGWLCISLAFTAKGPGALILPASYAIYIVINRRRSSPKYLAKLFNPAYILLFALIASPWYIYNYHCHHDALLAIVKKESSHVGTSFSPIRFMSHAVFYAYTLLLSIFPFIIFALFRKFRNRITFPHKLQFPLIFCIATLFVFIFFVNEHKDRYIYTILPTLAVITAAALYSSPHLKKYTAGAVAVSLLLLIIYVSYPVFPRESLKELVSAYKLKTLPAETLSTYNIDIRSNGWILLMSGGKAAIDTYSADYIITDEDGLRSIPDAVIAAKSEERTGLKLDGFKFKIISKKFFLAQRNVK